MQLLTVYQHLEKKIKIDFRQNYSRSIQGLSLISLSLPLHTPAALLARAGR